MSVSEINIYLSCMVLFLLSSTSIYGQEIEHNYLVGPQNTTCDSLPTSFYNEEEAINLVEQATFRSTEQFKINRNYGVRGGWYYSCDNKTGYLIILIDDHKHLFKMVPKESWEQLTQTTDFESFIINQLRSYKMKYPGE